jgi:hypothetical protein
VDGRYTEKKPPQRGNTAPISHANTTQAVPPMLDVAADDQHDAQIVA